MKWIRKNLKLISATFALLFVNEIASPTISWALTGHNSMPEYRSFEPVSSTNMVNLFNGSFTYNIPLLDVPNGYPINLSYHSNEVTNEALSSWVGLGWNINPGVVNRSKRGFPDEFKGNEVRYHNRMPTNWTISAGASAQPELFGNQNLLTLNIGASLRYNNYNGMGTSITGGVGFAGVANMDFSYSQGRFGFNPEINPYQLMNVKKKIKDRSARNNKEKKLMEKEGLTRRQAIAKLDKADNDKTKAAMEAGSNDGPPVVYGVGYGGMALARGSGFSIRASQPKAYPTNVTKYSGFMTNLKFDVGVNFTNFPIDFELTGSGSYSAQWNDPIMDHDVYGYQYNELATADETAMMDYYTEKEKMFEKRETFIGYPLPNNDSYSMSGEDMGGGFRAYRSEYGHYRKNKVKNEDFSVNVGADLNMPSIVSIIPPAPVGILNNITTTGGEIGGDYHFMQVSDWDDMAASSAQKFREQSDYVVSNEKYFYMFDGDKAGYYDLSNLDPNPLQADLVISNLIWADPVITWSGSNWMDARSVGQHKKRSTYILEHKNSDFSATSNGVKYKVYEKNLKVYDAAGTLQTYNHTSNPAEGVGEFVSYNADGVTYVYGLPVHARKEKNLQYSLKSSEFSLTKLNDPAQGGGLWTEITGSGIDAGAKRKLGQEDKTDNAYATTHLITQILGPDYVDLKGDGPTQDDFGNFTKFNYQQVAGGLSSWYPFRTPYEGVSFDYGSLSSHSDDMGGYSFGEKEVYYLQSVVSKTHVAIFTTSNRDDGLGAKLGASPSADDLLKGNDGSTTPKNLKKLDRIDLYSIEDCDIAGGGSNDVGVWTPKSDAVPLRTVHFKYNYSRAVSANGLLNTINTSTGKLTLEKVWFENGGVVKNRISPYVFDYSYYSGTYPAPYNTVWNAVSNPNGMQGYMASTNQNPPYVPINSDRWGNYRDHQTMMASNANPTGLGDLARFWPYVHQNPDPSSFDPAAGCLKQIKLPSGGQIHIQYEQNDYQYVQNKRAMVMIPLSDQTNDDEKNPALGDKRYYLDLSKVGIDYGNYSLPTQRQELAEDLFAPMIAGERVYFNFLYALVGNTANYEFTHSDYLDGYARINGYGYDNTGIFFTFKGGNGSGGAFFQPISYPNQVSKRELPKKVCLDFYKSKRRMKIDGGQNATALEDANSNQGPGEEMVNAFISLASGIVNDLAANCRTFDPEMSYVRLRLPDEKKKLGGGVRVKRLLMYDDGIYNDDAVLYGNEYTYTTAKVPGDPNSPIISSGVATNEPSNGRRESPLINPIDKSAQSKFEAILFGRDMYSQEGPMGESLLPGASVGYSEVTVKPIHQGKTGTGKEVHRFHTCKTFPFESNRTTVKEILKQPLSAGFNTGTVGLSYTRQTPHLSQGFVFRTNDMHGKQESVAKYAQFMDNNPVSSEYYEYFQPYETIQVMGDDQFVSTIPFREMGTQSEILSEAREVQDYSMGGELASDLNTVTATWAIPPFVPPFTFPVPIFTEVEGSAYLNEQVYRTHATTKIIHYPAMLKKVTTTANGVKYIRENVVFDAHTGTPVVVKSYDDFTGTYAEQSFKAAWEYKNMGAKYKNENNFVYPAAGGQILYGTYVYQGQTVHYLTFTGPGGSSGCGELASFVRGDYLKVHHQGGGTALFHVDKVDLANDRLILAKSQHSSSTGIAGISKLQVLQSGYTNQLNTQTGNIMYFSENSTPSIFVGSTALTQNHGLITAMNNAILPLTASNNSLPLSGTFTGISVADYAGYMPVQCNSTDLNNATIKNVVLDVDIAAGQMMSVKLVSFSILCGGTYYSVNVCS